MSNVTLTISGCLWNSQCVGMHKSATSRVAAHLCIALLSNKKITFIQEYCTYILGYSAEFIRVGMPGEPTRTDNRLPFIHPTFTWVNSTKEAPSFIPCRFVGSM